MDAPMPRREIPYRLPYREGDPTKLPPVSPGGPYPPPDDPPRLRLADVGRVWQGRGAIVCIIGTGIELAHPGLGDVVTDVESFAGRWPKGTDPVGHGTALAGVVAGTVAPGHQSGPACRAKVYGLRVWSPLGYAVEGAVVSALRVVRQLKPDVCLWGVDATHGERLALDLIHETHDQGTLHVAPAGSGPKGHCLTGWPAKSNVVLSVGALNGVGDPISGSAVGEDVDCGAWGGSRFVLWQNGQLATSAGPGIAAALVAGMAAVMAGRRRQIGYGLSADILRSEVLGACTIADAYLKSPPSCYGEHRPFRWLITPGIDGRRPDQPALPLTDPSGDPCELTQQQARRLKKQLTTDDIEAN